MYELIGHRGYSAVYPENTLLSFKKAVEIGCDGIELDVRLTKDNKVAVIHDDKLERTTNGYGAVGSYTLNELKKFDAGRGEKISSLEEVLSVIKGVKIFIEIKVSKEDSDKKIEKLCEETVKIIAGNKDMRITSFSIFALQTVKKLAPEIKTGLIFSKPLEDKEMYARYIHSRHKTERSGAQYDPLLVPRLLSRVAKEGCINILCPRIDKLDSGIMMFANQHKLDTYAWTIDTLDDVKKAMLFGVKGIISNDPGTVNPVRGRSPQGGRSRPREKSGRAASNGVKGLL